MKKKENKEDLTNIEINGGGDSSKSYNSSPSKVGYYIFRGRGWLMCTILIIILCFIVTHLVECFFY